MGFFGKLGEVFKDEEGFMEEEETFTTGDEGVDEVVEEKPAVPATAPKSTGVGSTAAALQVKVIKPESMKSAFGIGDHLLANHTVVLNCEDTDKETIRRILDFLGGVVYAIQGNIKKVSESTYIISPKDVNVIAESAPQKEAEAPKNRELF